VAAPAHAPGGRADRRAAAARHAGAGRHARLATAVRVLAGVLSIAVLAGSGWGWHLVGVAEASVHRGGGLPTTGNTDVNGDAHAGAEMNLLLVGMDSRTGLTAEQEQQYTTGEDDGVLNTDTMMLVHVPADGSGASFVSLPRDTYVAIPGNGQAKLNSAYALGYNAAQGTDDDRDAAGMSLLVQTVSQFTGLHIDHYAEIDLLGFLKLSDIVGGVQVNLCQATSDDYSGASFPAGVQTITPDQALAFVRQRHELPQGDIDRTIRQQVYLGGILRNLLSTDVLLSPSKQQQVVTQVGDSVTLDPGLDVFDLASQLQGVRPSSITFQTIPGLVNAKAGRADVLQPPAADVVQAFFAGLGTTPSTDPAPAPSAVPATAPSVSPADVAVQVRNGSGRVGAAATAATELEAAGFPAPTTGNAAATALTTVSSAGADAAAAALVAAQVPGAAVAVDESLPAGTVRLVLGADFRGVGSPVAAPAAATTSGSYDTPQRTAGDTGCID
jgi:LCP family protein required for cell wall assembly